MKKIADKISLKDLNVGDLAEIIGYRTDNIPPKLYEMGFIQGTRLEIKNKAPFGGPICVSMTSNKTIMALRKTEADCILINKNNK